jgi:cytochrome P450
VLNFPRVAVEELSVGGYRIEPGTRVAIAAAATHLLSRLFRDPLRFDPERYADPETLRAARPFQMLTFAGGSRICMGLRYAQLEFKAVCAHLVTEVELATADESPVPHAGFWNARPGGPLRIRLRPRVRSPERRAPPEARAAKHGSHGD